MTSLELLGLPQHGRRWQAEMYANCQFILSSVAFTELSCFSSAVNEAYGCLGADWGLPGAELWCFRVEILNRPLKMHILISTTACSTPEQFSPPPLSRRGKPNRVPCWLQTKALPLLIPHNRIFVFCFDTWKAFSIAEKGLPSAAARW